MSIRIHDTARMKDIAARLGISKMTVSKVFRNGGRISEDTRRRVLQCAKELNYSPDLTARSLATGRTYLVGMVVPDLIHPFFAAVAKLLGRNLQQSGNCLVISCTDEDPALELHEVRSLLARRIDTLVLASSERSKTSRTFQLIQKAGVSCVLFDRPVRGFTSHFIGSDHRAIGKLATEHLIGKGYRRIAHLGFIGLSTGEDRLRGYKDALKRAGLPVDPAYLIPLESSDEHGEECGYNGMLKLLTRKPRPDAVFCFNDIIASGAQKAVLDKCLTIPHDVALIGASNLSGLAPWNTLQVPLSTIDQNVPQLAEELTREIISLQLSSSGGQPKIIYVPSKLVARESS